MTLMARLEKSLGWIAIERLPLYVVTAQALIYIWLLINPEARGLLMFDPYLIRYNGEYWRLLTFLFVTPVQNAIFAFFFLYLLFVYGMALEEKWGAFTFTLFYLLGVIGTIVSGFFFGGVDGTFFLNTTLFLAFAALYPDFELYLFFVIPLKIKWLAVATWLWLVYEFVLSPAYARAAIVVSLINYFVFFGKTHVLQVVNFVRRTQHRMRYRDWNN